MSIRRCPDCEHPYGGRDPNKRPCECHGPEIKAYFVEDWAGMANTNPRDAVEVYMRNYSKYGYVDSMARGMKPYKAQRGTNGPIPELRRN